MPNLRPSPITPTVDFDAEGVQHGFLRLPYSRDDSAWGSVMIPICVIRNGEGPTGLAALLNVNGMLSFAGSAWIFLKDNTRETARTAAPTVATYVAAVGLLASALGMWWWADRRLQF